MSAPLQIQTYLRNGGTPETLLATYGITAKRHGTYPNLVLFKYNQIASPMGERIVQECRGIILDERDNWRFVARAFDKFFNHGEGHAAAIDWTTARYFEKLDGSLCVVYLYANEWHVGNARRQRRYQRLRAALLGLVQADVRHTAGWLRVQDRGRLLLLVALHHAKDGLSQRAFITIAQSGETPEVIAAFPELKPMLDEARERLDSLVAEVEADFARLKSIETQKDFAAQALKTRCSAALFSVRAGKAPNVRAHFAGVHIDQMMRLLGYKDAPVTTGGTEETFTRSPPRPS